MTLDWFLLLTPILVAVIVLPFVFVGCAQIAGIRDPEDVVRTTLKLNLDPLLQSHRFPSADHPKLVTKVTVTWTLLQKGAVAARPLPPQDIVSHEIPPSVPPQIRPQIDPGLETPLDDNDPAIGTTWNSVRCECAITVEDGTLVTPPPPPETMDLVTHQANVFWLRPVPDASDRWGPGSPFPFEIFPDVV